MKTAKINTINNYYTLLNSLSPNIKIELIARLTKSINLKTTLKDTSWKSLFGAIKFDNSADEFILELKNDRKFSDKSFDL